MLVLPLVGGSWSGLCRVACLVTEAVILTRVHVVPVGLGNIGPRAKRAVFIYFKGHQELPLSVVGGS